MTEDQVNMLNSMVKVRIAPSKVHGVGVFALKDILKGEKVYANAFPVKFYISKGSQDKLFPEVKALLQERWPAMTEGEAFLYPDCLLQAYMNHSDDPNYDNRIDMARRDIKKGEEIFEDYRNIKGYQNVFSWLPKPKDDIIKP